MFRADGIAPEPRIGIEYHGSLLELRNSHIFFIVFFWRLLQFPAEFFPLEYESCDHVPHLRCRERAGIRVRFHRLRCNAWRRSPLLPGGEEPRVRT